MPLWRNTDAAGNSAIFAAAQVKVTPNTANRTALFGNTTADAFITGVTVGQFGVDTTEEKAARGNRQPRPAHAGWVLRTEGSGGRAGRIQYETLVAFGSLTGDASDDTQLPDAYFTIATQPADVSVTAPATAQFTIVVSASAGTPGYQWQVQEGGTGSWTNVSRGSGGTTATYTTGATQVAASGTADSNGDKYRCIVSLTGAANQTSSAATLTVTA